VLCAGGSEVGDHGLYLNVAVNLGEAAGGGDGFGQGFGGIGLGVQELPLEVGWFYEVPIYQSDRGDAGAGEDLRFHRAERSAADNGDRRRADARLASLADGGEPGLA
ncbi:MAG: hypothetical protein RL328_1949, partial [Acidobacteriota bacterium]